LVGKIILYTFSSILFILLIIRDIISFMKK
jgi:hypothetical protein